MLPFIMTSSPYFSCSAARWYLTKHFVLGFGKLVEGGLDEVTLEMVHVKDGWVLI